ncbi:hypothetical protein [Pseudorhodobacter sp.]|uniref:hypothetical protein n=1 Tax=Pseudorhodobacter sp. TaxID=1934400 RepID=UPI002649785D|nr:hypothetical protein [Pseudorhodobacter sp.]MDN5789084.1 hypothetical protein [Pseudorhodobacter sp.]
MQDENWGPWFEWLAMDGKQPPVKVGVWVDAHGMTRPGHGRMFIWRAVFQTLTCDSFRTMTDLVVPSRPGGLIYRYRVRLNDTQPSQVGVIEAETPECRKRFDRDEREIVPSKENAHIGYPQTSMAQHSGCKSNHVRYLSHPVR